MLVCDACDEGWHIGCLTPALPRAPAQYAPWYCPRCSPPDLGTAWVAMQNIDLERGESGLCVLPRSHLLPDFDKIKEGDDEELPASYFTDAEELVWHVASYEPGDVVIFNWKLIHASTLHGNTEPRLSLDLRWGFIPSRRTRLSLKLRAWAKDCKARRRCRR